MEELKAPHNKQNVAIKYDSTQEFEEEEMEVEDEEDDEQRRLRIKSLKDQDLFWKICKEKQNGRNSSSNKGIQEYLIMKWKNLTLDDFYLYFKLFNNYKKRVGLSKQESPYENGKKVSSNESSLLRKQRNNEEETEREEYETPGEDHGIDEHMKYHSFEKPKQSPVQKVAIESSKKPPKKAFRIEDYQQVDENYTPDDGETPLDGNFGIDEGINQQSNENRKAYEEQQLFRKKQAEQEQLELEKQEKLLNPQKVQQQQQQVAPQQQQQKQIQQIQNKKNSSSNLQSLLPKGNGNEDKRNESFVDNDAIKANKSQAQERIRNKSPIQDSKASRSPVQENGAKSQAYDSNAFKFQGLENNVSLQKNGEKDGGLELGQEEISNEQREYLKGDDFRFLVKKEILPDLKPDKDSYDNEEYIIISKESKWNRIYLKKSHMYIQLRVFTSPEAFSSYIEGYDKIVARFTIFMPQTIFQDKQSMVVIQKLGDFSLYDLSNLIIIESKAKQNVNYERSFLQVLSGLFNSLVQILSANYYIGNISPKNVFISKTSKSYVIKFSNLVDFSFDYNSICDKNYASVSQPKPQDHEIWFSELYSCCRSMQEMIDKDKYYLQKKNIRDFINRHKQSYPKIMNILSFFLMAKGLINTDQIRAFLNSSIDSFQGIGLSERSTKHIQSLIKASKLHLREDPIEISQPENDQKIFFFVQQLQFQQDYSDEEIKYMLKYLNRVFYNDVLEKVSEPNEVIYQTLEIALQDASVFRRDKHLQRNTYAVFIMYYLRVERKVDKCIPYWKYMSQTTSLVENSNPISLYYVGLYNQLMLDSQKSSKYFAFCSDQSVFEEDIVPSGDKTLRRFQNNSNNFYDDFYEDEDYSRGDWRKGKKRVALPTSLKQKQQQQQQALRKKKGSHQLFSSFQEADNTSLLIREAYGLLAQIKYAFLQETSIKRIEHLLKEAKVKMLQKALLKVIELELSIAHCLKTSIVNKIKQRVENMYFVEQVSNSPGFSLNSFAAISKSVQNQITLTDNLKRQCTSSSDILMQSVASLLSAHAQLQAQIVDAVSFEKRILNYSPDKYKGNILNYFNSRINGGNF